MTPEKLKLLAEALGYETAEIVDKEYDEFIHVWWPAYIRLSVKEGIRFEPNKNPAQREEVLLWLLGKGWELVKVKHKEVYQMEKEDLKKAKVLYVLHEDYTTALMMAAERELG